MNNNLHVLQNQALWILIYYLGEDSPETQRSAAKCLKKLRKIQRNFMREVCQNCKYTLRNQKQDYVRFLKVELKPIKFTYDENYLYEAFKSHGEDLLRFPEMNHNTLPALLRVDCSAIWKEDTSLDQLLHLRSIRKFQGEFLRFAYNLILQEILTFIEQSDQRKKESLENPQSKIDAFLAKAGKKSVMPEADTKTSQKGNIPVSENPEEAGEEKKLPTHKQFVAVLKNLGFFQLDVVAKASNTSIADFVKWGTGRNDQNMRKAINNRLNEDLDEYAESVIKEYLPPDKRKKTN